MFRAIMKNCVHHVNSNCCINSINVAQILHFNARSLIPKLDELKILCVTYEPAVRVVETWLSEEISDAETPFLITLLSGIETDMEVVLLFITESKWLEFMLVCLCNSTCKLCIGLLYRPPSSPASVLETMYFHLLEINVNSFSNFVLLGDLNIDCNNSSHPLFANLCTNTANSFFTNPSCS